MNLFQGTNLSATAFVLGAVATGVVSGLSKWDGSVFEYLTHDHAVWLLALLIVLFRIKTTFDDHHHFAEPHQQIPKFRYPGFILAILSWLFLGLAGYFVYQPTKSAELFAIALLISLAWLVVHLLEITSDAQRRVKEVLISVTREKWALFNVIYIICLIAFLGWFKPAIEPQQIWALLVLSGFFLIDILTSRSYGG